MGGKELGKKDIVQIAMSYGHVYVAQVAYGAKDTHTLKAFLEADSYDGPSLIIAYAPCIEHGVHLSQNLRQQNLAVDSGHWSLLRHDPRRLAENKNPLQIDSKRPSVPYKDFLATETRFSMLFRTDSAKARHLLRKSEKRNHDRYFHYQQLAGISFPETEVDDEESAG